MSCPCMLVTSREHRWPGTQNRGAHIGAVHLPSRCPSRWREARVASLALVLTDHAGDQGCVGVAAQVS